MKQILQMTRLMSCFDLVMLSINLKHVGLWTQKPHKIWHQTGIGFITYEPFNRGVFLGHDHLCKLAEINTVQIKMHDETIRKFKGVKHIPYLKKALISLGSLEKSYFEFGSEDGGFRVSKGALLLM